METSPIENQTNSTCPPIPIPICNGHDDHFPNFTIDQEILAQLVETNDNIHEIAASLQTNIHEGLSGDTRDLLRRHESFGSNQNFHEDQSCFVSKGFHQLMLEAYKDTTIALLLCCATLSLAIGIKRNGLQEGFLDGAIIFLAIFLVINFSIICRFFKARRMKRNLSRDRKAVGVKRRGRTQQIATHEVVVGDILCLKTGDRIPADGLLIDCTETFKLDEDFFYDHHFDEHRSIFSGAKVVGGECRVLVTSVGKNTEKSKLMRSLTSRKHQTEESKLQISIDKMKSRLEKVWLSLSLFVLVVQVLRCFVWRSGCDEDHNPDPKGVKNTLGEIMNEATKLMKKEGPTANGLVAMLCVLLLSMRDGLPLGIFISLSFAARKILPYQAMVRKLPACATIGLVTTLCTGKTSDLVLQHSKMAELWIGFDNIISEAPTQSFTNQEVLNILREGVGMNLSGQEDYAILFWAEHVLGIDMEGLKQSRTVIETKDFDLNDNRRGLSLRRKGEDEKLVHVHWRGAPNKVLSMCSHYCDIHGAKHVLDEEKIALFNKSIGNFEIDDDGLLQCLAFAYKQVVKQEKDKEKEDKEEIKPIENGLTFLGMVRLKNPYPPKVRETIKECQESGVDIKLVVGDDIDTARLMAINSRILKQEERQEDMERKVIDASEFRYSSEEDRMKMIDHITVMANSTPSDKLLLLQCLKQRSELVAVTGVSTRDSPSLEEADVGLSMGENAAEAAKEASDIIVLDHNFVTISAILKFGRYVCNNLQKFVQLELILNIVAFTVNFIVGISNSEDAIGPFQLLWVNLIMDILGALALAELKSTQIATETNNRPSIHISKSVWRNIVVQSLYQITVLLIVYFKGKGLFHMNQKVLKAMVFNCYVLCQVFVLIDAREIEKTNNVFEGITKKDKKCWFFVGAIVVLQIAAMEIMVIVFHAGRLDLKQWCICMVIGAFTLPVGWVTKKWLSMSGY